MINYEELSCSCGHTFNVSLFEGNREGKLGCPSCNKIQLYQSLKCDHCAGYLLVRSNTGIFDPENACKKCNLVFPNPFIRIGKRTKKEPFTLRSLWELIFPEKYPKTVHSKVVCKECNMDTIWEKWQSRTEVVLYCCMCDKEIGKPVK